MNLETSKGEPQIPPEKKLGIYKKTRDKQYDDEKRNITCVPLSDGCKMMTNGGITTLIRFSTCSC
jgi:hypothetical protein